VFRSTEEIPAHKNVVIAVSDAFVLSVLSSAVHLKWCLAQGSKLEDRPVYVQSTCFETFPFPALEEGPLKQRIRDLGERLDAHRKHQQAQHPDLTLTGIYNVLEKLRSGEALNAKDKDIHDKGLVSVLKQLHDDLDAAVLEAYGWTDLSANGPHCSGGLRPSIANEEAPPLSSNGIDAHRATLQGISFADLLARGGPDAEALEQAILTHLVALNHERAAEEKRGLIRYLRPDYQAPGATTPQQSEIGLTGEDAVTPDTAALVVILDWPTNLPAQVAALRKLLPTIGQDPETLAACFGRKSKKRVDQITAILDTLKTLGLIS
jgi:hypothetical protein